MKSNNFTALSFEWCRSPFMGCRNGSYSKSWQESKYTNKTRHTEPHIHSTHSHIDIINIYSITFILCACIHVCVCASTENCLSKYHFQSENDGREIIQSHFNDKKTCRPVWQPKELISVYALILRSLSLSLNWVSKPYFLFTISNFFSLIENKKKKSEWQKAKMIQIKQKSETTKTSIQRHTNIDVYLLICTCTCVFAWEK